MKKIPTMFVRDWTGDRSRVLNEVTPGCEWVQAGEGIPTRKIDGTCCRRQDGLWWKRRELRKGDAMPDGFEIAGQDDETGKTVGWVLVGTGPEDQYMREAMARPDFYADGTYELIGPKVQGNPEGMTGHFLIRHGVGHAGRVSDKEVPRDFDGLKAWFTEAPFVEGIVFHHPDGRMAKIKVRDFGIKRIPVRA